MITLKIIEVLLWYSSTDLKVSLEGLSGKFKHDIILNFYFESRNKSKVILIFAENVLFYFRCKKKIWKKMSSIEHFRLRFWWKDSNYELHGKTCTKSGLHQNVWHLFRLSGVPEIEKREKNQSFRSNTPLDLLEIDGNYFVGNQGSNYGEKFFWKTR